MVSSTQLKVILVAILLAWSVGLYGLLWLSAAGDAVARAITIESESSD